ncbi:MAG TPA: 3-methyl-2-oxobutanoate hydroxymethyltransferase [Coprothermobacter proteolyticus]|uniref:3-methyl-2-oxobutanoate hydroxymethyltransferase n=1 Tax=Coprothermobacter proteolyticus TaxID=35786 RepID=UPI000D301ED3|nr:3-methyl-2-oxobutanoate hydroxymethyltransferase [Coprothermobacter proteolyticus]HOA64226.1 3-methyl-2-oxobutanoate hydroxymethyltransferase [Coprothermobacter proteolyticus]HPU70218.1 3-methyl-2-oxobutanoate hydroxymethyltransferase [Coprothermobacter proteolyticus]
MNATQFKKLKGSKKIIMLTCYDFSFASALEEAGVDALLVGDSLGNVVQGKETTLPVTLDQIIYHTEMVKRGAPNTFVVADMPFLSYQISVEEALRNCGQVMKETNCDAVKLEGGEEVAHLVRRLTEVGIPVMGHIGVTPQSAKLMGYGKRGKDISDAEYLKRSAKALYEAGAFSLVLENMAATLAKEITELVQIPTIGIGAGPECDGQVLVLHDFMGLTKDRPPFAKAYFDLRAELKKAVSSYKNDVEQGKL